MSGPGMLEGLMAFWNSMTFEQRAELTRNLNELTALSGSLKNRGIIAGGPDTGKIVILKRSKEVTRLKQLVKLTGAKNITFTGPEKKNKQAPKKKPASFEAGF